MSLTLGGGPLAADRPDSVNYQIDGPRHLLFAHSFPRRVRAVLGGHTILDSDRGLLVHESNLLPVLYVPFDDLSRSCLTATDHRTHCPFKGDASYWTVSAGGRVVENAVWSYPDPKPDATWLRGMAALYWDAPDSWYDEEEAVRGHLRDPFHRVDVRQSSSLVRVSLGERTVALTGQPKLLSETGLPNRYYLPMDDVRPGLLTPSRTKTYCPYKGESTYWNLRVDDQIVEDVAWSYPHPLKDGADVAGYVCFLHDDLTTTVERQP